MQIFPLLLFLMQKMGEKQEKEEKNVQIFPLLVPLLLPVTQICLTGSLYTVLAVAIERFLAVTRYFCHGILLTLLGTFDMGYFCHRVLLTL